MKSRLRKLVGRDKEIRSSPSTPANRDTNVIEEHTNVVVLPEERNKGTAKVKSGQRGLFQLKSDVSDDPTLPNVFEVDIIAIHGLGGDVKDTWTHENGTFWLEDLLPNALPGARVFSYGYPSGIFWNNCVGDVRQFAQYLLNSIALSHTLNEKKRPIIYVCHSLGGIVFKKAMNMANDQYPEILSRSKGVLFMGTPHKGSDAAGFANLILRVVNAVWHASGTSLLQRNQFSKTDVLAALNRDSPQLMDISDTFAHRAGSFSITTFYEQMPTYPLKELVVPESSAVIGVTHEWKGPLWEDHRGLCRFENEESESYKHVVSRLKLVAHELSHKGVVSIRSASTVSSLGSEEKRCASILNTIDITAYEAKLDGAISGTLQWIQNDPLYEEWVNAETTNNLFIITGYPGCGKTTIAKRVVSLLSEKSEALHIVCRHFFDANVHKHSKLVFAFRSLLYQLVSHEKNLIKHIRRASDIQGQQFFERPDALWKLLSEIFQKLRTKKISIVLDALDECDEDDQVTLARQIAALSIAKQPTGVKFFITSRSNAVALHLLRESKSGQVILSLTERQTFVDQDIEIMIEKKLDSLLHKGACNLQTRDQLEAFLLKNADRTFLWVSLVLSFLEKRRFIVSQDLSTVMHQIPTLLSDSYRFFLRYIDPQDMVIAKDILQIICFATTPLNIDEINLLLNIILEGRDESLNVSLEALEALLGPLVKIINQEISPIHQTLGEFLKEVDDKEAFFCLSHGDGSLFLSRACMQYLASDEFDENVFERSNVHDNSNSDNDSTNSDLQLSNSVKDLLQFADVDLFRDVCDPGPSECDMAATRYKLLDYAATNWHYHYRQCESHSKWSDRDLFLSICNPLSSKFLNWIRYYKVRALSPQSWPKDTDPLIIASFFDFEQTLADFLESSDLPNWNNGAAVFWASQRGHQRCLKLLLDRHYFSRPDCYIDSQSPLFAASKQGNLECVSMLVDSGLFDVDEKGPSGRTALSVAAASGHVGLVQFILKHCREHNPYDAHGWSPLHLAVSASAEVVKVLLNDSRTLANSLDRMGRNALSWAASEGSVECIRLLMRDHQADINNQDLTQTTPLIYAVQHKRLDIVIRLLTARHIDTLAIDKAGRNAVSWASERPSPEILRRLLEANQDGADCPDNDGWAPLAWALNAPGYEENINILLRYGVVNVNRRDSIGRSPVSYAAGYGYTKILKLLAGTSHVDLDLEDDEGRTPLSYAAGNGHFEIAEFLLSAGVAGLSRAKNGLTPLDWAEKGDWPDVALLLRGSD